MAANSSLSNLIQDLREGSPGLVSLVGFSLQRPTGPATLQGAPAWKSEHIRDLIIRLAARPFAAMLLEAGPVVVALAHGTLRDSKLLWVAEFQDDGSLTGDALQAGETQRFFANTQQQLSALSHPLDTTAPAPEEEPSGQLDTAALNLLGASLPRRPRARLKVLRQRLQQAGLAAEANVFPLTPSGGFRKPWLPLATPKTNLASNLADFARTLRANEVNGLTADKEASSPDLLEAKLFVSRNNIERIDLYLFTQGGTAHALFLEDLAGVSPGAVPTLAALVDPSSEALDLRAPIVRQNNWHGLRRNAWWVVTLLALVGLALFSLTPGPFDISAKALVQPAASQSVTVPFHARLLQLEAQVGDTVQAGQIIATLDAQDIRDQQEQMTLEYILQEVERRSLDGGKDVLGYQVAELRTEIAKRRKAFFDRQAEKAAVRAPVSGVIADRAQPELVGSMMAQGERLYELQTSDDFRVELTVRPQDIAYVTPELQGTLILQGDRETKRVLTITRQPRVFALSGQDGRREFLAEAEIAPEKIDGIDLQKGLLGLARIRVEDERPRYWLWSREVRHFINLKLWQFFGLRWPGSGQSS